MERDFITVISAFAVADFNSHAHVERDRSKCNTEHHSRNDFNSHAHVERDGRLTSLRCNFRHFNSHAHVERDRQVKLIELTIEISTHTLTWSVTKLPLLSDTLK